MVLDLPSCVASLQRTPAVLRTMLAGMPDDRLDANCGGDTFSPRDVVGHLIHGESTDWIPRLEIILSAGESRPFDPFDRYGHREATRGRSLEELLDEFEKLRRVSVASLLRHALDDERLARKGTHPALGSVTAAQLIATWVVHDLDHVAQIARTLAFAWRDDVGPWREYLPILPHVAQAARG